MFQDKFCLISCCSLLSCCSVAAAVTHFPPRTIDSHLHALLLRLSKFTSRLSYRSDVEEWTSAPSACLTEELRRLRAEEQEKQLQLQASHRQEVELLRAHYWQQAAETEERYHTELFMLQQRLQEVAGTDTHFR